MLISFSSALIFVFRNVQKSLKVYENRIVSAEEATDPDTTSESLQPTFQVKYNQNHLSATGSPIFAKNPTVAKISAGNLACKQDESFHSVCPIVNLDTLSRFSRCETKRDFEMFTFNVHISRYSRKPQVPASLL